MALLHDADYDGTILQRNMANADYLYRYPRMQSMAQVRVKPYRDEYMDLTSDPYAGDRSSDEDDSHVSGDSVRAYVNRLLFNAALKMTGEHVHNQGAGEDTKKLNPERLRPSVISYGGDDTAFVRKSFDSEPGISYNRTPRRNQNKGLKKRRRRKSAEEKEAEKFPFSISSHQDGHPIFSASVYQLRDYIESEVETKVRYIHQYYEDQFRTVNKERMSALAQLIKAKESEVETKVRYIHQYYEDQFRTVNKERMSALAQLIKAKESEVETKVRYIHQYYEDQFRTVNKERMSALAQLIKAKETCYELQKRLEQAESHLLQYKSLCDNLASQVQSGKAARRRRRLAKKHRKSDPPSIVDRNGAGDKNDNPEEGDNRNKDDYFDN